MSASLSSIESLAAADCPELKKQKYLIGDQLTLNQHE